MAVSNSNRRETSLALIVISTGIFLLAVLFSMVRGFGLYVSLALLVLGCFSMIGAGILRESQAQKQGVLVSPKIVADDSDDGFS